MGGRKGTVAGLIGGLALIGSIGQTRLQAQAEASKPAAIVNGVPITWAEVESALNQQGVASDDLAESQRRRFQSKALADLIDREVMRQFLARKNVSVDASEVDRKMAEVEADLKAKGRSLQDYCRDHNWTADMLRAKIDGILQWQTYARQHLTDADVVQFYRDNKDFFDRNQVRISHILLRLTATATAKERDRARVRLTELRAQIISGKLAFAEAAKRYSQCSIAGADGDLGFVLRKWMVEEPIASAAFALPVGQVSDIIETDLGLHLVKVTDRQAGPPSDFARIKYQVADACIEDLYFRVLAEQRKAAKIEMSPPRR